MDMHGREWISIVIDRRMEGFFSFIYTPVCTDSNQLVESDRELEWMRENFSIGVLVIEVVSVALLFALRLIFKPQFSPFGSCHADQPNQMHLLSLGF